MEADFEENDITPANNDLYGVGEYLYRWDVTANEGEGDWVFVSSFAGPQGDPGTPGHDGTDGTSVTILGSYDTAEALRAAKPTGQVGDSYLVAGDLYIWSASINGGPGGWVNVGRVQGPQGEQGIQGIQGPPGSGGNAVTIQLVVYYPNGGMPLPDSPVVVVSGSTLARPADMSLDRHLFGGWYTTRDFTGNPWNFNTGTVNQTTYLYAKWNSGLDRLVMEGTPYKYIYAIGEEVSMDGLIMYAVYTDGAGHETFRDLIPNEELVITGFDSTTPNPSLPISISWTHDGTTKSYNDSRVVIRADGIRLDKTTMNFNYTKTAAEKINDFGNKWGTAPATQELKAMIYPLTTASQNPTWTVTEGSDVISLSAATETATVGSTVTITAEKPGYATITATNDDDGTVASCTVYVYSADGMMGIKPGDFMMGSPENEAGRAVNEGPQHKVTLTKDFLMARYLVTREEWQAVMNNDPSRHAGVNFPVTNVTWYMALVYCNARSTAEGLVPVYQINGTSNPTGWPGITVNTSTGAYQGFPTARNTTWDAVQMVVGANGYRMPTEAEWEYACRAKTTTTWFWGNTTSAQTAESYAYTMGGTTTFNVTAVGQKLPNPWGLYDILGMSLEPCWGWLGDYTAADENDPKGLATGTQKVKRGGHCGSGTGYAQLRSAARRGQAPYECTTGSPVGTDGLRVVRGGL